MNERTSGDPSSLTNPSGEVHSNNHTTPWPNYLNIVYTLMFYNNRAVRELMTPKYEELIRNAFNLYLQHLSESRGVSANYNMTFTNYVLNSLVEAGFFMSHETTTADEIEGWRVMHRFFIGESYTMQPSLAGFLPNSALQLEAAYALQSAVVLRSVLPPQSRFGSQELQFPVHPGHLLSPPFPHLPQFSSQLPLPPEPSPQLPLPLSIPPHPARTDWSIETLLSSNHTITDESPAPESRPEMPASTFTHRSADSPSDCVIISAPEHFKPFPSGSFQQLTDRSYELIPATSANSSLARSCKPSTSRSFQPTAAPSFERASENLVGRRLNERTDVGTIDPPEHSHEPPVTRSNQSSERSTKRSSPQSLESATAPKYQTYPAPYFRPSIGSGYSQASSSGFVPPTRSVDYDTSSGYQQSTTHANLSPPTTSIELRTTFENEASMVPSSEPPISSTFKPPATRSFERSTVGCSEPPPAHIPMRWPIPDHLPMPMLPSLAMPPSLSMSPPLPMPPRLPRPTLTVPPGYPSVHMPVHFKAHMPILRANQVQMAAPPFEYMRLSRPEHTPLPPRRRRRVTTGCPICRTNTHK